MSRAEAPASENRPGGHKAPPGANQRKQTMQTHHHDGALIRRALIRRALIRRALAPQAITPRPTPAGMLSDAEIRQIIRETLG